MVRSADGHCLLGARIDTVVPMYGIRRISGRAQYFVTGSAGVADDALSDAAMKV
jgi:hypothetical protein